MVKATPELNVQRLLDMNIQCLTHNPRTKTNADLRCLVCGYEWNRRVGSIVNEGHGCKECYLKKKKLTYKQIADKLALRGFTMLTKKFNSVADKATFQCSNGHQWETNINSVYHADRNCPNCSLRIKVTNESINEAIKDRGITCLTTEIQNNKQILLFECQHGHQWSARSKDVIHKESGCPYCGYKREQKCRNIIEELTGKKFVKTKQVLPSGYELDGYCEELQMAFEHQGEQHYSYIPRWFHKEGIHQFEEQLKRDQLKIEECVELGIELIVIPYTVKNIQSFIQNKLKR